MGHQEGPKNQLDRVRKTQQKRAQRTHLCRQEVQRPQTKGIQSSRYQTIKESMLEKQKCPQMEKRLRHLVQLSTIINFSVCYLMLYIFAMDLECLSHLLFMLSFDQTVKKKK